MEQLFAKILDGLPDHPSDKKKTSRTFVNAVVTTLPRTSSATMYSLCDLRAVCVKTCVLVRRRFITPPPGLNLALVSGGGRRRRGPRRSPKVRVGDLWGGGCSGDLPRPPPPLSPTLPLLTLDGSQHLRLQKLVSIIWAPLHLPRAPD